MISIFFWSKWVLLLLLEIIIIKYLMDLKISPNSHRNLVLVHICGIMTRIRAAVCSKQNTERCYTFLSWYKRWAIIYVSIDNNISKWNTEMYTQTKEEYTETL